jgi:SPP1 gp7 family putative phage head morphogenesis protein
MDSKAYQKAFQRYLRYGISLETQLKAKERFSSHYIWRTQGDERVRPEHAARDGQVFSWDDPAISPPGTEFGCRCIAVPYHGIFDPPIEPVYPELLLYQFAINT